MLKINCLTENNIPYIIRKGKYKRLTVKYDPYGNLNIVQPYNYSNEEMVLFIEQHISWILNHKPNKIMPHDIYESGMDYLLLGKNYKLEIVLSRHESVIKNTNSIVVYTKDGSNVEELLDKFRYEQAEVVFQEMFYKCFLVMQEHLERFPKIVIKKSKTMWGCCYTKENKIMFNISLIHVDLPLIEYVMYHELCHFKYPNHSSDFHNFLRIYIPDENIRRKLLKNYSIVYK